MIETRIGAKLPEPQLSQHHHSSSFIYQATLEVVKVVVAAFFLEAIRQVAFRGTRLLSQREIFQLTVLSPIAEEILFRGIVLNGIKLFQKRFFAIDSQQQDKNARAARIHLSSLASALSHMRLPFTYRHPSAPLLQCSWSYLSSLSYGYMDEKYQTLSASILAHGISNAILVAAVIAPPRYSPLFLGGVAIYHIGLCILGFK